MLDCSRISEGAEFPIMYNGHCGGQLNLQAALRSVEMSSQGLLPDSAPEGCERLLMSYQPAYDTYM